MSLPSAPPATDPAPPTTISDPPGRPRRVAPAWPVWRERMIGLAFLGVAVLLWFLAGSLSAGQQVVLWSVLLLALALVVRQGWLPLLGPIFFYDLIRTTRRGRYAVLRAVYATALLLFILALYRVQPTLDRSPWSPTTGGLTRFAETFCYTFLAVQFLAVAVLTPAYVAGAIAEEKDRKTLEFLLATDVRDREIVLGKMASRVANLVLLVLTGLPILSLTQLWGGVDFGLLLAAFANTGLTLLTLAAVSMLASVYSRKARDAVVLAYLVAAAYVGLSVLAYLLNFFPSIIAWPVTWGTNPYTVGDVVSVFGAGNPGLFCLGLREDIRTGVTLQQSLVTRTSAYAAFHLIVTVVCTCWAVLRLRPLALLDGLVKAKPRTGRRWRFRWRPRPGRNPLLWKEVWAEPGLSFNWFGKAILLLIILASLVPALWLLGDFFLRGANFVESNIPELANSVNVWVRIVGTLVACLTLLGVAVRAASSISGEHDRQTYDSLLTAPIDSDSLLFAKFLGSVLSVRRAWLWMCLVWLLGSVTGGLYAPTVPWLFLAWGVYAGFVAVVGLWFSMTCRTTLRATVWTLLTLALLGVGHWYLWAVFCMPLRLREDAYAWLVRFQMYGLTPPLSLSWLAFRAENVESGVFGLRGLDGDDPMGAFACLLGGLALWSAAGYVLWRRAVRRFRVLTGRVPISVAVVGQPLSPPVPEGRLKTYPTKRRLRWRVLLALPAGAVLLLVGWGIYRAGSADRHLNEAMDEVDRTDPNWHLGDIEAARKSFPPDQNSGDLVLKVSGLIPRWTLWPNQELASQLEGLPPQVRLSEDHLCRIIGDLGEIQEALLLVGPLADMPEGRYTVNWRRDYIGTLLPHVDAQHRVRLLLWHDLMQRAEEGDPDGALADCRRLLNLGRSLGDEPIMVSQMVRNNAARGAVRGAERVLAQGEPGEAALADLQRRLAEEDAHPGLAIGLRGERPGLDGLMGLIQTGEFPWQEVASWADEEDRTGNETTEALLFSVTPGGEKESRAAILRHISDLIAVTRLPEAEQGAAFAQADARRKQMPLLARLLAPRGSMVSRRFREGRAELRCAVAALAAERYRRRHKRWPERLEELTPDLLEKVPPDPFTGEPLRLRRLADGVVIYSVGDDRQDDGGDVDDRPAVKSKAGKDVGFRLWDVSKRRQEAPAAVEDVPPG
jgi:ABC-type transport system involved in multi-copper enzyme maturation permease subunit